MNKSDSINPSHPIDPFFIPTKSEPQTKEEDHFLPSLLKEKFSESMTPSSGQKIKKKLVITSLDQSSLDKGIKKIEKSTLKHFKDPLTLAFEDHLNAFKNGIEKIKSADKISDLIGTLQYDNDWERAFSFAQRSADEGVTQIYPILARFYQKGKGTKKDLDLAKKYYHLCLDSSQDITTRENALVQLRIIDIDDYFKYLLKIYQGSQSKGDKSETEIEKDRRVKAYEKAKEDIYLLVKELEQQKDPSSKDLERVFRFAESAAEAGLIDMYENLGRYYEKGIGTEKNSEMARLYFGIYARKLKALELNFEKMFEKRFKKWSEFCEEIGCTLHKLASNDPIIEIAIARNTPSYKNLAKKIERDLFKLAKSQGKAPIKKMSIEDISEKNRKGVCTGIVLSFNLRLFADPEENMLKKLQIISQDFEETPPVEGIAFQNLSFKGDIAKTIYSLKGYKMQPVGGPGKLEDEDRLMLWGREKDGCFHMIFNIDRSDAPKHAVSLIKDKGKIFLFDPNLGLVECPDASSLVQLIKKFYHKVDEHSISIYRVEKDSTV